jgi:type II secretory pathway pseudopilin PulG
MIELLMVIILVGVLSAVALPAFLDFRKEGKLAATRVALNAMRVGIRLKLQQAILRCNATPPYTGPLYTALYSNDITAIQLPPFNIPFCTTAQIPNPDDRRVVDSPTLPDNPFLPAGFHYFGGCSGASCADHCIPCTTNPLDLAGWCITIQYNNPGFSEVDFDIWPNSNVAGECAIGF